MIGFRVVMTPQQVADSREASPQPASQAEDRVDSARRDVRARGLFRIHRPWDRTSARKTVALVFGDKANAESFAAMLSQTGLRYQLLPQSAFETEAAGGQREMLGVDLVVVLSCCKGGYGASYHWAPSTLDRFASARVLACGDSGASLLQTKELIIGHPHGAHGFPRQIAFPLEVINGPFRQVLTTPNDLLGKQQGEVVITIDARRGSTETVGMYDGGGFPAGTQGIGRAAREEHHWMICKQGNFVLWGADSHANDLTEQGKALFVNLCWCLAHAESEELILPPQ
jgi:hypothetical protein